MSLMAPGASTAVDILMLIEPLHIAQPLHIEVVSARDVGAVGSQFLRLFGLDLHVQHADRARDHAILQGKQILRRRRNGVGPQLLGAARVNQTDVDAHVFSGMLPACVEHEVRPEFRPRPLEAVHLALADLAGRRNFQRGKPG